MPGIDAEERMERYALLRWGFLATDPRAWAVVRSPEWVERLSHAITAQGHPPQAGRLEKLRHAAETFPDAVALEGAHHEAFGRTIRCSPYETDYTSSHAFMQARDLADVSGFYRAFGYKPPPGGERVDHVAPELEFLYALAHQEAALQRTGDTEGAGICRDATMKFLESHTGRFLGRFEEALSASGAHPFFVEMARLARLVVDRDVTELGLHPALPPAWSNMLAQEPDEPRCEACPVAPAAHDGGDDA